MSDTETTPRSGSAIWWAVFLPSLAGLAFLAREAVSLTPVRWSHIGVFVLLLVLLWLMAIANAVGPRRFR